MIQYVMYLHMILVCATSSLQDWSWQGMWRKYQVRFCIEKGAQTHSFQMAGLDRAVAQFPLLPAVCKGAQVARNNEEISASLMNSQENAASSLVFPEMDSNEIYWNSMESSQETWSQCCFQNFAEADFEVPKLVNLWCFHWDIHRWRLGWSMASECPSIIEADARHAQCLCGRVSDESE